MKIGCILVKIRCFQECFETMSDFQKPQKYGDNATARKIKMVQISHFLNFFIVQDFQGVKTIV